MDVNDPRMHPPSSRRRTRGCHRRCRNALQPQTRVGWIKKADTLEGLAELVGIDPKGLASEVERFKGFAQAGQDDDFGRASMAPLGEALITPSSRACPSSTPSAAFEPMRGHACSTGTETPFRACTAPATSVRVFTSFPSGFRDAGPKAALRRAMPLRLNPTPSNRT